MLMMLHLPVWVNQLFYARNAERWASHAADEVTMRIAWRIPRRLAYWCAVRVAAHATTGAYSNEEAPALRVVDMLRRWDVEKR